MYTNNKKGPRMRKGKYSKNMISKELWRDFRKAFPEYKEMSDKELSKRWKEIAELIRQEAIFNPLGTKLGSYTGELKYQYLPNKFKAKDSHTSSQEGRDINHTNLVTKGKVGKIKWERRWAVNFNKMLQFYGFEPTREMHELSKQHTDSNPEQIRMARNTLGGHSIWRQL